MLKHWCLYPALPSYTASGCAGDKYTIWRHSTAIFLKKIHGRLIIGVSDLILVAVDTLSLESLYEIALILGDLSFQWSEIRRHFDHGGGGHYCWR